MAKSKYSIGYKFNNITIIEYLGELKKGTQHCYYKCRCKCGKEINILSQHIKYQKNCGCSSR